MCKTIYDQVGDIRHKHNHFILKRAKAQARDQKRKVRDIAKDADEITQALYERLRSKIYDSCGLSKAKFYLPAIGKVCTEWRGEIINQVQTNCGLTIKITGEDGETLEVDLTPETGGKKYGVCYPGAYTDEPILDFPRLIRENSARRKVWKEYLPTLAAEILDECQQCLENVEDKFYGIPPEICIKDSRGNTPFSYKFQITAMEFQYQSLTCEHLRDLQEAIKANISHAGVRLEGAAQYNCIFVYFYRAPEIENDQAKFDYEDFCSPYDAVTPELQEVFDEITNNIVLASREKQIATLQKKRKLFYWFQPESKLKFATMKSRIENGTHYQHLLDAVNEKCPGITVQELTFRNREETWHSLRGCAHGALSYDERIEFEYTVDNPKTKFIREQIDTEGFIEAIRCSQATNFATQLAHKLLDEVRESDLEAWFEENYTKKQLSAMKVNVSVGDNCCEVDLETVATTTGEILAMSEESEASSPLKAEAVANAKFLAEIAGEVHALTVGLLHIELRNKVYWITP